MKTIFYLIALVFIAFSATLEASAPRDGGGANAQTQALIQQLGSERTRLSAENAKLKKKVKELESELETVGQENAEVSSALSKTQNKLSAKSELSDELVNRLNEAKSKLTEIIAKFRETISNLRKVENESAQRAQEITRLDRELKTCATSNVALSELGFEILAKYEDKGFWDRMGQNEPFTKIKKVQIENLVDDYTYLVEDQEYVLPDENNATE